MLLNSAVCKKNVKKSTLQEEGVRGICIERITVQCGVLDLLDVDVCSLVHPNGVDSESLLGFRRTQQRHRVQTS